MTSHMIFLFQVVIESEITGGECNIDEHTKYFPPELINSCGNGDTVYYCYVIELKQSFQYEVQLQEIVLAVPTRLGYDLEMIDLDLDVDRGKLLVHIKYMEHIILTSEQVLRFIVHNPDAYVNSVYMVAL